MKKILFAFIALLITTALFAQFPGGMPAGGKGTMPAMNIGHIYGKLIDSTGKPLTDASVILLQNKFDTATKKSKEVLLKAVTTKASGEFSFEELPLMGMLKLKISAIGFKTYETQLSFMPKMEPGAKPSGDPSQAMTAMMSNAEKDLGKIKLAEEAGMLKNVTVTSSVSSLKLDIDKKVFNVEKNIVSAGGTAVDIMRNVPSLQVDIDGNVKLRNAAPQLYIDGRPTTLSLDQIPADAIESVEVITNPSAKFDASGGNAGILNIVLKKNKKTGYNGNIMAGVDKFGGFNGGGNFSLRQDKFNFSAAVMANARKDRGTGITDRTNFGDTAVHVNQTSNTENNGAFIFGRLGLDYFVSNKTTLSAGVVRVHGEMKPGETLDIYTDSIFNGAKSNATYSQRISNTNRVFNATGVQLGLKHNFSKAGENISADLNSFSGHNSSDAFYTTNYYNAVNTINGTQLQKVIGDGTNKFLTVQTDYENSLSKKTKLEAGARVQINKLTNNNFTYLQPVGASDFTLVSNATTNYKNTNQVYAAYASISSSIKDFGYKIGLRAESSSYDGELTNTKEKFSNSYPISLFPSVFLSQKLSNKQQVQASFTRRINRPNFFQLIPYTDYTDSLNITRGNPNLLPEFTNSFEVSYSKTFTGNNTFLASLYYKHTNNLITRFLQEDINPVSGKTDLINTYINANSSYAYGAEFTSTNAVAKWWDLTTNINLYKSKINTDNITGTSQDALLSWFGKFNSNFKLPKNFTIQLSADYQSKTNLPVTSNQGFGGSPGMGGGAQSSSQGYIKSFWGTDIAIKKTFLKNNAASVTLNVSDIFRTRYSRQVSQSPYFYQEYYRQNNPQMIRLNFSYRFGKMDFSLFKRQNTKSTGSSDAMQMGGQ